MNFPFVKGRVRIMVTNFTVVEEKNHAKDYLSSKLDELVKLLPEEKPLGLVFETKEKKYYYDSITGKVLVCGEWEYKIISNILDGEFERNYLIAETHPDGFEDAVNNVIDAIKGENILRKSRFSRMYIREDYESLIDNKFNQVILELTERCNLRCGYCTYNEDCDSDRGFGERDMSEEVARKAIDYAIAHSTESDILHVTFYGGEPLLRYDLMKKCMDYVLNECGEKVYFAFTTNCMAVTAKMAKELSRLKRITVTVSIDGPEDIHDMFRKDKNGNGSFRRTLNGLRLLVEAFGERSNECIAINMVYTPPFSFQKIDRIREFFGNLKWLPEAVAKSAAYPRSESLPLIRQHLNSMDGLAYPSSVSGNTPVDMSLLHWCVENYNDKKAFLPRSPNDQYLRVFKRRISEGDIDMIAFNGCCIPGQRRLYVTVDGHFKVCERMGDTPFIGNIEKGIDKEAIKSIYLSSYAQQSFVKCATCWLGKLCDVCYESCYDQNGINMKKKNDFCTLRKTSYTHILVTYFEMLEKDPHTFDEMVDVMVG